MQAPASGTTTVLERPPPGPARGAVAAPVWLVALTALALALLAGFRLLRVWRKKPGKDRDA